MLDNTCDDHRHVITYRTHLLKYFNLVFDCKEEGHDHKNSYLDNQNNFNILIHLSIALFFICFLNLLCAIQVIGNYLKFIVSYIYLGYVFNLTSGYDLTV